LEFTAFTSIDGLVLQFELGVNVEGETFDGVLAECVLEVVVIVLHVIIDFKLTKRMSRLGFIRCQELMRANCHLRWNTRVV